MSIFSFVRGEAGSRPKQKQPSRSPRKRRSFVRRSIEIACTEMLEDRRLLSSTLVSANYNTTTSSNGSSDQLYGPFISSNGRYVAFESMGTDLTTAGTSAQEVYLRDRISGITRVISLDSNNEPAAANSWVADMSPDGRYVLFFTAADMVSSNVNGNRVSVDNDGTIDLYVRDTQTNQTFLVSGQSQGGGQNQTGGTLPPTYVAVGVTNDGTQPTLPAYISDNGQYVAFASDADGIPDQASEGMNAMRASDNNGVTDLFVRDRTNNLTLLVSEGQMQNSSPTGTQVGTIDSYDMSADGGHIAFSTTAEISSVDNNATSDVYYRDVLGGSSIQASTINSPFVTSNVAISPDGTVISFLHTAGGGTHIDEWAQGDGAGTSQPIAGDGVFGTPALSQDGTYDVFYSDQTDLLDQPTDGANVFRYNRQTQVMEVVSLYSVGGTDTLLGNANGGRLSISSDGRYVAYQSDGTGTDPSIVDYGATGQTNVYVRDMTDVQVSLLNTFSGDPMTAGSGDAWQPMISSDGRVVVYISDADDLVTNDSNGAPDVFTGDVPIVRQPDFMARLSAPNVSTGGATSYTFQVTYSGPRPIVLSSIDDNDIIVANMDPADPISQFMPGYMSFSAKLVSVNSLVNATALTATYQIVPPGGAWDVLDNGTYYIYLENRQIADVQGDQLLAQDLGTFQVAIPTASPVGPTFTDSVSESAGTYTLTIRRNPLDAGNVTGNVDYQVLSGTATLGVDFTVQGPDMGTIQNLPPNGTYNLVFNIINDSMVEGNESFSVVLSNETVGATTTFQKAVITIVDDDSSGSGTIYVPPNSPIGSSPGITPGSTIAINNGVPTITAPETTGSLVIPVSRAGTGSTGYATTFNYIVYSAPEDSAVAGQNFVAATGTLTFNAGSDAPVTPLTVQLLHDNQVTGDLTFTVVLTNATTGLNLGGTSVQVVEQDVDSSVQFDGIPLTVADDNGIIDIPISRVGNLSSQSTVTIGFGGSAINGVDYRLVNDGVVDSDGNVTFAPGEAFRTVHVQVLGRPLNLGTFKDLSLTLSNPTATNTSGTGVVYASILGAPSTETIRVDNVDATSPQVDSFNFNAANNHISKITVTFTEDVIATSARKLSNYAVFTLNKNGKVGHLVKLVSGKYDPGTFTATLIPAKPLAGNKIYQLNVNGKGTITDLAGNQLDGDANGTPMGTFHGIFGYGRKLSYADSNNDLVSFSLSGPGNLKLVAPELSVTLDVLDPEADQSILTGKVSKRKGGDGKTVLELLRLRGAQFNADQTTITGDIRADV